MIEFILILLLLVLFFIFAGWLFSVPRYDGQAGNHFNGRTFRNIDPIRPHGFKDVLKVMLTEKRGAWNGSNHSLSTVPEARVQDGQVKVSYINHTSFLVQAGGLNLLTDPVYSKRVSPVSFAGPARKRPPGINFSDLPVIHAVLVSHNHYDHMDIPTLKKLQKKFNPVFFTPLGNKSFMEIKGLNNVIEMDWWDHDMFRDSVRISCVPARHFSGRGMFDRNRALWGGFVLEYEGHKVYFAGDTAYGSFINLIAERFAPVDLAILPIGAYQPSWFVSDVHASPSEALQMHYDMKASHSIASHFGTFPMAWEGEDSPVNDLLEAIKKSKNHHGQFHVLRNGESLVLKAKQLQLS